MDELKKNEQDLGDAELNEVAGGIIHHDVELICPNDGEDKLHGREVLNEKGEWVVQWYCPRCKQIVFVTGL